MDNQPKPSTISGSKLPIKVGPKSLMIIGVIVILLVAGGMGFWFWQGKKAAPTAPATTVTAPTAEKTGGSIGTAIFEKYQNPISDKLPETNLFLGTETNPLKRVMKNPF